jgi:hypothetical protein
MFLSAMLMLNGTFAGMVSKFLGNVNLADGMAFTAGIRPMGTGLQDPVVIWTPLVRGVPGRVRAQKLM